MSNLGMTLGASAGTGDLLFGRRARITIDTLLLDGFDAEFEIKKTLKSIPNTCKVSVYNLNSDHRAQLEELRPAITAIKAGKVSKKTGRAGKAIGLATTGIPCKIEAGYGDNLSQLWLGDLRTVNSVRSGGSGEDWVTELESGDAEKAYQNARIHVSYGPQTQVSTALRAMIRALNIGEGNLSKIINDVNINGSSVYPVGTVISGSVADEITAFAKSAGLTWSIQDGSIQFINLGATLDGEAILVSEDTGMIGSPTVDSDGLLTTNILMTQDVRPGRLIVVQSERIQGGYKIEQATWMGSTFAENWTIEIVASRY